MEQTSQSYAQQQPIEAKTATKYVFLFQEGNGKDRKLLGGKGAGLCEMTQIGLPVPPGFVITTQTCLEYFDNGFKFPKGLTNQVRQAMAEVEKAHELGLWEPEKAASGFSAQWSSNFYAWNDGYRTEPWHKR